MKLLFIIILPAQKYTICITVTISQSYKLTEEEKNVTSNEKASTF